MSERQANLEGQEGYSTLVEGLEPRSQLSSSFTATYDYDIVAYWYMYTFFYCTVTLCANSPAHADGILPCPIALSHPTFFFAV